MKDEMTQTNKDVLLVVRMSQSNLLSMKVNQQSGKAILWSSIYTMNRKDTYLEINYGCLVRLSDLSSVNIQTNIKTLTRTKPILAHI